MKKMTKLTALLLVLCLSALALCACGEGKETTAAATPSATQKPTTANTNATPTAADTTAQATEPTTDPATDPAEKLTYSFRVVDEEGNPVEGAQVQVCKGDDFCLMPVKSDAQGMVEYDVTDYGYDVYDVHILKNSIPAGYEFDNDQVKTSEDVHEYTLVLKKKCDHKFVNEQCSVCGATKTYLPSNPMQMFIGYTGFITMSEARVDENPDDSRDTSKYFFSVKASKPEDIGRYRVTVTAPEGVNIVIGRYNSNVTTVPSQTQSGRSVSIEFNMEKRYLVNGEGAWTFHTAWLFGINAENESDYPVTVQVRVERIADLIPGVNTIAYDMQRPNAESDATADSVLGDLTGKTLHTIAIKSYVCSECGALPKNPEFPGIKCAECGHKFSDDVDLLINRITPVLGADGYYHVNSADGPILLVNLANDNAYLTTSFLQVNELSVKDELMVSFVVDALHQTYIYYEDMLKQYGALCNADGYYMVNEQLYTFLTDWVEQNVDSINKNGLDKVHAILPLCGYYE